LQKQKKSSTRVTKKKSSKPYTYEGDSLKVVADGRKDGAKKISPR